MSIFFNYQYGGERIHVFRHPFPHVARTYSERELAITTSCPRSMISPVCSELIGD